LFGRSLFGEANLWGGASVWMPARLHSRCVFSKTTGAGSPPHLTMGRGHQPFSRAELDGFVHGKILVLAWRPKVQAPTGRRIDKSANAPRQDISFTSLQFACRLDGTQMLRQQATKKRERRRADGANQRRPISDQCREMIRRRRTSKVRRTETNDGPCPASRFKPRQFAS